MRFLSGLVVFIVAVVLPSAALAHKSNIGLLDIREKPTSGAEAGAGEKSSGFVYTLNWSFTGVSMETFPTPVIPAGCERVTPKRRDLNSSGVSEIFTVRCSESLVGHAFRFQGDAHRMDQLVLVFSGEDGEVEKFYTRDNLPAMIREADFSTGEVKAGSMAAPGNGFFSLGFKHMILGWDHLLFVFCLLLLTGINRRIVLTVTGFTIGHSLTLLLAARDLVSLPSTPVEILIALSIVYMAAEVLRVRSGQSSIFSRFPMVISLSFGLLHGLGFSGVLDQMAFSEQMSFTALLLFNLGIEAAQLLVVACIALVIMIATRLPLHSGVWQPRRAFASYGITYAMGTTAGYWVVERTLTLL